MASTVTAQDRFEVLQYGSIVGEDGKPVAGIEVRGLWRMTESFPYGPSLMITRTDEEGKFFVPLPVGNVKGIEFAASDGNGLSAYASQNVRPEGRPIQSTVRPHREHRVRVLNAEGEPCVGVNVSAMHEFLGVFLRQTDENGEVTIFYPEDYYADAIVAWDNEKGIDYIQFDNFGDAKEYKIPRNHSETVELKLHAWETRKLLVVDLDGKPIPNATLSSQYLCLSERGTWQPGSLGTTFTDDQGWGDIRLTDWTNRVYMVHVKKPGYLMRKYDHKPEVDPSVAKPVQLVPNMPVAGRVLLPSGMPAEGVLVSFEGVNSQIHTFKQAVKTDERGRFSIELPGNSYGLVLVATEDLTAPIKHLVIRHDQPFDPLTLKLEPKARVSGKLIDRHGQPMPMQTLRFENRDGEDGLYFKALPPEQRLEKPPRWSDKMGRFFSYTAKTDHEGNFEVFLGPGQFEVQAGKHVVPHQFTVNSGEPRELELRDASTPGRTLKIIAFSADGSMCNADKARVSGVPQTVNAEFKSYFRPFSRTCDAAGKLEVEVPGYHYAIWVTSQNSQCVGFSFVAADADQVEVLLGPTVQGTGTLLQPDGSPLVHRRVTALIEFEVDGQMLPCPVSVSDVTDAKGRFDLRRLMPGHEYTLRVSHPSLPGQASSREEVLRRFTTEKNNPSLDLGEVKVAKPKM